jgi:ribose transport system substrate-binding protein
VDHLVADYLFLADGSPGGKSKAADKEFLGSRLIRGGIHVFSTMISAPHRDLDGSPQFNCSANETVMKKSAWILLASLALVASGCKKDDGKITVGYVTNGIDPFWTIAEKGAKDAAPKFDVNVEVRMPPKGVDDQKRMVQELLASGIKGIAISPIDADNQGDLLNEIAANTKLITHDSDAPKSKRLCYVGMDNYDAGRMCGKLVKKAMPDGGTVMIFVGRLGQDNARLRNQGVIDELKDSKWKVLDTRTDGFDRAKAKQLAQDAMTANPDLGCMVGLFAYNPPICLDAIKDAGKLGKIKIVAFDENKDTLQAIKDGHIIGTVVQNPYKYGYESVRILAGLARNDQTVLPKDGTLYIPARSITAENLDEYWKELKQLTGQQ